MRALVIVACAAGLVACLSGPVLAADDEQAVYDEISAAMKAGPRPAGLTRTEFEARVVAHLEGILKKCEDYRKRFPKGQHLLEVCAAQVSACSMLWRGPESRMELLEKGVEAARKILELNAKAEVAPNARIMLIQYNIVKERDAKTPAEAKPFQEESLKEAQAMVRDFPKHELTPVVLSFIATTYERTGREKESDDTLRRIIREFPDTPTAKQADLMLKMKTLKGTTLELSFTSTAGEKIDLKNYRGKVVLVDFWASWCGPCKESMPHVIAAEKKFRDRGFRVIGISLDQNRADMDAFIKEKGMPWPQHFDGGMFESPLVSKYYIYGIPMMFLIDRKGTVREIGLEGPKVEAAVQKLLDEKTP